MTALKKGPTDRGEDIGTQMKILKLLRANYSISEAQA